MEIKTRTKQTPFCNTLGAVTVKKKVKSGRVSRLLFHAFCKMCIYERLYLAEKKTHGPYFDIHFGGIITPLGLPYYDGRTSQGFVVV